MENKVTQLDTPLQRVIHLDSPIPRGNTTLTELVIRPPKKAGHLRGLNTMDIVQMNVDTLIKLLPRITTPILTEAEIGNMDPADLLQLGSEVAGFLMPKKMGYLAA